MFLYLDHCPFLYFNSSLFPTSQNKESLLTEYVNFFSMSFLFKHSGIILTMTSWLIGDAFSTWDVGVFSWMQNCSGDI